MNTLLIVGFLRANSSLHSHGFLRFHGSLPSNNFLVCSNFICSRTLNIIVLNLIYYDPSDITIELLMVLSNHHGVFLLFLMHSPTTKIYWEQGGDSNSRSIGYEPIVIPLHHPASLYIQIPL